MVISGTGLASVDMVDSTMSILLGDGEGAVLFGDSDGHEGHKDTSLDHDGSVGWLRTG